MVRCTHDTYFLSVFFVSMHTLLIFMIIYSRYKFTIAKLDALQISHCFKSGIIFPSLSLIIHHIKNTFKIKVVYLNDVYLLCN